MSAATLSRLAVEFDAERHAYSVGGRRVPSVTQILAACGIVRHDGVPADVLARKAALGTLVHAWTARHDQGDEDWDAVIGTEAEPYCLAWSNFREQSGFAPTLVEQVFAHELHGMRYAGTLDRLGTMPTPTGNAAFVVEIKTSAQKQAWWGPQLAGYALAVREPGRPAPRRIAVQLAPDGGYTVHEFGDVRDEGAFTAALAIETWKGASHAA